MMCETGVPHEYEPDNHFCCKMRYKRSNGGLGVTYQGGREVFHDSDSVKKQENDHVSDLKAKGIEFERAT